MKMQKTVSRYTPHINVDLGMGNLILSFLLTEELQQLVRCKLIDLFVIKVHSMLFQKKYNSNQRYIIFTLGGKPTSKELALWINRE